MPNSLIARTLEKEHTQLRRSLAIFRIEVRILLRAPVPLIVLVAMPIILMSFITPAYRPALIREGHLAANGAEQAVPGMAVMFSFFLIPNIGLTFFREHGWSTWERLRASPARTSEILFGKTLLPLLMSLGQLLTMFVVGGVIFDLKIRGSLLAIAAVAVTLSLCLVALGLLLTAWCRSVLQLNAAGNLGALFLAGVGGALTPIPSLSGWTRSIAPATPSYWAMRGFRSTILDGGGVVDIFMPVLVLAAFAACFLVLALARFRVDERKLSWV